MVSIALSFCLRHTNHPECALIICLFYFRFERFDDESFQTLQQALVNYIQSEYVLGSAEADAACRCFVS